MHGPGKGGPGKTTTTGNIGAAIALEFLRHDILRMLHELLVNIRSYESEEQQEKWEMRVWQQMLSVLLQEQAWSADNLLPVLQRTGVPADRHTHLIDSTLERQSVNKVLIFELDPQLNTSKVVGMTAATDGQKTAYDIFLNPWAGVDYAIQPTLFGMDIVQGRGDMYGMETLLAGPEEIRREYRLDDALRQAKGSEQYHISKQIIKKYPLILLDVPPTLGLITLNAMVASDFIVAIIDMGALAIDALDQLWPRLTLAQRIQEANNGHQVELGGIICNKYDQRPGFLDQCVLAEGTIRQEHGDKVFDTIIPYNPRIFDSPTLRMPVQYNDPKGSPTKAAITAYTSLAQEYIQRFKLLDLLDA